MVTPANIAWAFILIDVLIAVALGVLVGLVSSLLFRLRWNIKAAAADVTLAILGYFAVGLAAEVIAQFRQNVWPPEEKWFWGIAAGAVAVKQLVRLRRTTTSRRRALQDPDAPVSRGSIQ
jgi:hypothetical protein